jgi:eukaryotic-like serine/threonine-protein kinase
MTVSCSVCKMAIPDDQKAGAEWEPGTYLCDPCLVVKRLLELANAGDADVTALRGHELVRQLGTGGMGAVYLLRGSRGGEHVALKIMLPQDGADPATVAQFLREIEVTKSLRHPNVVLLKDAGYTRGVFFFTLEFCDGGSVDKLMQKRGGTLAPDEAVPIILQSLAGLSYAHQAEVEVRDAEGKTTKERGVVHRDVKPHNIFLTGSGASQTVKVADLGLAKPYNLAGRSGFTRTGQVGGTPGFMPRQQVIDYKYAKPEVDVWATAASLYYLLTGHTPRDFPRNRDAIQVILSTAPMPIRQRQPSVPSKLAEVIDRALVDKPSILFATALEFEQALKDTLA